jgi:phage gpG-like protein
MKLEFDFGKVIQFTSELSGEKYETLKRSLLTIMIRQKDKIFMASQSPDGTAWVKLSKGAAARKIKKSKKTDKQIEKLKLKNPNFEQHKILIDTSTLMKSVSTPIAPAGIRLVSGNEVVLGTNVPYAAIQNFGGTITKANGVKIVIPARPFIGFGQADDSQIKEKIEASMKKIGVAK